MNTTNDNITTTILNTTPVLAMYDVRGIQEYIFRTSNTKDVIGASIIVENIIEEALKDAVSKEENSKELLKGLSWETEDDTIPYEEGKAYPVQVLYIGGGNAYVTYESKELCIRINKRMSKYVMEHTYSLQLAVAYVEKTKSYEHDHKMLRKSMDEVKANMRVSKPIAAFPIMKVETETGFAVSSESKKWENCSTETILKRNRKDERTDEDKLGRLIEKRGIDSTLAVVHIDGNNMGLRIRSLIEELETYPAAVTMLRKISHNINKSYKECFDEMAKLVRELPKCSIYKLIVAGDDITYICSGACALASVEDFARRISQKTMDGSKNENLKFSICAGIAYIQASSFAFGPMYEIAENCCDSAKKEAKEKENIDNGKIGNWVDFQIVKNLHETDILALRERDYVTYTKELLTRRPYFIPVEEYYPNGSIFMKLKSGNKSYLKLKNGIRFFENNSKKDYSKQLNKLGKDNLIALKNAYSSGRFKVDQLFSTFTAKRYTMPDSGNEGLKDYKAYYKDEKNALVAKWYDALELIDLYIELPENVENNGNG